MDICMNKLLLGALLLLPASLLPSCVREAGDTLDDSALPYEIFAPSGDTRTVNAGLSTRWSSGDKLGVFHAPAGSAAYVADGAFTIDDPSTGHAKGTVHNLVPGSNDWYLTYPVPEGATRPDQVTLVFGGPQTQQGYGSPAHLAGETYPLAGVAKSVSTQALPSVSMHPLLSVAAVHIKNTFTDPVRITSVSLSAPVNLQGRFQTDLRTPEAPVLTPASSADVSRTATVEVADGELLPPGAEALVYIGICPVQLSAESSLTLAVHAEGEAGEPLSSVSVRTLSQAVSFGAGKIKALNVSFTPQYADLLSITVPGAYDLDGLTQAYAEGTDQLSVRRKGSDVLFRILSPSAQKALEVTGLPADPSLGDAFTVTVVLYEGQAAVQRNSYDVEVLRVRDGLVWLKTLDEGCIIAKFR